MQEEVWRKVSNYEGYEVSNLGNVKSFKRSKELLLSKCLSKGYYVVKITSIKQKSFPVHQLVAMAFLNHTPCGHESVVDHINNNKLDNRLENLRVVTNRENVSKDIKGCYSIYTGVSWHKNKNKWIAGIRINGKSKHLGYFTDEYEAYMAYQNALNEYIYK